MALSEVSFNRPIPGQGLTHELGARPWQNPPQLTTVDETVSYYMARMGQDEFAKGLLNVIELGVPLTVLANTIQMAGVMEGKHSVDVGILVMPSIIETMRLIADSAGVEYDTGMKDDSKAVSTDMIKRVAAEAADRDAEEEVMMEEPVQEELPIEETAEPKAGLMARRV